MVAQMEPLGHTIRGGLALVAWKISGENVLVLFVPSFSRSATPNSEKRMTQ